jgi:hypothetical protein
MPIPCTSMAHMAIISRSRFAALLTSGLTVLPADQCPVCDNYQQTREPYEGGMERQPAF